MNINNRTIYCKDNLDILQNIDSECVDMIYLDPPFNKNQSFTAPIGSSAKGASFKDIFGREDLVGLNLTMKTNIILASNAWKNNEPAASSSIPYQKNSPTFK